MRHCRTHCSHNVHDTPGPSDIINLPNTVHITWLAGQFGFEEVPSTLILEPASAERPGGFPAPSVV